ncbi:hypothetical protein C3942_16890 [Solimonas fluminis]|uniref:Uncharacterized protein n=1 Tax=Solimonas fluminis TaxID=2086571 RepID=A0A2S5TCN5_9GAMM|nr:hypothetical protein [Solimonas fluminis]PPE72725.1 hypothetical protein C3942_16890 [Solimonas fluminis]
MGLFGGGNKQSQTTNVTDTSAGASVAGDAAGPVSSLSVNAGSSKESTFNFLDQNAIAGSFDFAKAESERSFGFATAALDKATRSYTTTADALTSAYNQSLNTVSKAQTPADEKTRQQFMYLALGALALVAVIFWAQNQGTS